MLELELPRWALSPAPVKFDRAEAVAEGRCASTVAGFSVGITIAPKLVPDELELLFTRLQVQRAVCFLSVEVSPLWQRRRRSSGLCDVVAF